jgi:alginate O-acetyltransferase complex protein AlgI
MVFSSSLFLLYFLPTFLLLYYLTPNRFKNLIIVLASILFYSWGGPQYILIIFFSIFLDFTIAKYIFKASGNKRRILLILGLTINLGFLAYFKYANFFLENVNILFTDLGLKGFSFFKIALPIGISFFTFHEISYIVDVYRNDKKPMTNIIDYGLYILFFPQLIAGPIIRYNEIADQINDRRNFENIDNKLIGFFRFCIGLAKKVLIANVLGAEADKIFAIEPAILSTSEVWIGVMAYAFQIYFDFSGYSDMAIGIARMLGFVFPENFNNPYTSASITEFWRRWHMTLSRWMRDYLYIPLGGSKVKTKRRLYFNLWIVFVFSGFWHGAAWNFLAWGVFHGFFLAAERLFLNKFYKIIGKYPSILFTFIITLIGWVLFRSETLSNAIEFIKKMFSFVFNFNIVKFNNEFWIIFIVAAFFSFIRLSSFGKYLEEKIYSDNYSMRRIFAMSFLSIIIYFLAICSVTSLGFNPFIYFRF